MLVLFDLSDVRERTRRDFQMLEDQSRSAWKSEGNICRHLGDYDGIVECFNASEAEIEMRQMAKRHLKKFIVNHKPDEALKLRWTRQAARTTSYLHAKHIVVGDVATRNFLVSDDMSLKLCDFGDSIIMHSDGDITRFSVEMKIDIAQFGSVIYELVTGFVHETIVFDVAGVGLDERDEMIDDGECLAESDNKQETISTWPREDELPSTRTLPLGEIISKC